MNLLEGREGGRGGCKILGLSAVSTFPAGSFPLSQQASQQAAGAAHLRMLGCWSWFISCTSRSVFPRLLGSLFIFSTMTCPDCRCRTWGCQGPASLARVGRVAPSGPPSSSLPSEAWSRPSALSAGPTL